MNRIQKAQKLIAEARTLLAAPVLNLDRKATRFKQINDILKQCGREEYLVQGDGYLYFDGGEAMTWFSSSVPVNRLGHLTIRQVLQDFEHMSGTKLKLNGKELL